MNDLNLLANIEQFEKGLQKRLTIDGVSNSYDSYKIPIKYLYFNDLNGRISTYIEEYQDTHPENDFDSLKENSDSYNDLIGEFIKKSASDNEASFKKTKNDIFQKGQQVPGVILSDGRIIDGNRRFTAIRELYKESGDARFAYFECVCLETPTNEDQWKRIKTLELQLQFNVDEKKDYNKIDLLVSFYKDVMEKKIFDEKTYTYASGMKKSEFKNNKAIVEIMLDYLEWRGKPKAFYILKNEKLDGPIEDIAKTVKKCSAEEWAEMKNVVYSFMTFRRSGDRTRDVRSLLISAKNDGALYRDLKSSIEKPEVMEKVLVATPALESVPKTPEESDYNQKKIEDVETIINRSFADGKYSESLVNQKNEPLLILSKVAKDLNALKKDDFKNLDEEAKGKAKDYFKEIRDVIDGLDSENE